MAKTTIREEEVIMESIYAIRPGEGRQWCITLGRQLVRSKLSPAAAIQLARRLARERYQRTGAPARVEFLGGVAPIVLGMYGLR
ncbi:hypothetical protein [Dyella sp. ASV21]|uniref:hypothetical protein n=1 Tax=Dyella sp. ASV21 TaxID=2795114 RepID=UPI0018EC005B|nr:hypothetical protein [Dyella sp. ASV21]